MALTFNNNYAIRMANNHKAAFDGGFDFIKAQLYSTNRAQPTGSFTFSSNDPTDRLVDFTTLFQFKQDLGELTIDPANPPVPTAAAGTGTASWITLWSLNISAGIFGPVSLVGGNGMVHIINDGAGGGSGLSIQPGDNISLVAFRLKWG